MRKRGKIESDGTRKDILTLEVLLDLRDLIENLAGLLKKMNKRLKDKKKATPEK